MSADNEHLVKMVAKLETQQAETNGELRGLTKQIGDLVTILARKEAHDENNVRRIEDLEKRVTNHGTRLADVEKVQAGQQAERKIVEWVVKPAITLIVAALVGGALYAYGVKS